MRCNHSNTGPGRCLLLALLVFCLPVLAQGWGQSSSGSASALLTDAPLEFLPVEEAYHLSAEGTGDALLLSWVIAPEYYLYQHKLSATATDSRGEVLTLSMEQPPGKAIYDEYYEKELVVYYDALRLPVELPAALQGQPWTLSVESQGCADAGLCYPPRSQYFTIAGGAGANLAIVEIDSLPMLAVAATAATDASALNLPLVLLFALLGGIILNLMPCVFPVLSIKVLSLTSAHLGEHGKHLHGLAYSAGIVISFVAIAALLLVFREAGEAVGWGFQLQSPVFVSLLAYLLFAAGLSFSGLLEVGARWMNIGQGAAAGNSLRASFMTGVLATVVASPCSAPFMGTALGFALTQTPFISLLVFAVLGVGMALPFVLLSWIPGLLEKLPAPGPWMVSFRQFLAFPLYASAIWLLWVLGRQTSIDQVALVSIGMLLLAFAAWLGGGGAQRWRQALALLVTVAALSIAITPSPAADDRLWEPYTPARLQALRSAGQPVFVNLTAAWCITCLANEKMALSSETFAETLRTKNIVYLKGDWTNRNSDITALLKQYGRSGVPLYLYYSARSTSAQVLPQLLTQGIVQKALAGE
ncbi:MAG: thioredoxin family protein [Gammaproteobacteria bacterium]|nr:thioredoxin family protein [Gammaproteobacteria bacterium]MBQ0840855.1 thioredoxin family protein [Gammaproteobacteria bacterium]